MNAAGGLVVSSHARHRASELGFTLAEVEACVASPDQSYPSHIRYGAHRRVYQRGDLAVVVAEDTRVVVTVLLRRVDRWEHGRDRRAA